MSHKKLFKIMISFITVTMCISLLMGCGTNKANSQNQVIKYNLREEPKTIDPALNAAVDGATVLVNAFDGLTRLDMNDNPVAAVAESWDISDDGLVYTFHLRKNTKWSDGKEVTAKDFDYAWKRALNPKTAAEYAYQLYYIKNGEKYNNDEKTADDLGIKVIDEYTLEVTLEYPTAYFLSLVAFPTYFPVRQDMVEKDPEGWARNPETYVSNGPFKMLEWKPKDTLTFVKNDNYWNAKKIKLSQIEYKMITNETSYLSAFKTGELDYIESPPQQEIPTLVKEGIAQILPNLGTYFYCINLSDTLEKTNPEAAKVLKDVRVRKALSYSIDRQSIIDNVAKGGQLPATGYVPNGISEDESGKSFKQKEYYSPTGNIEEAKNLLAEAGYPEGKGFPKLTLLYNTSQGHQNIAQAVQEMWRKNLGITIELRNQEWKVFQTTRNTKQYEIARHGWLGDYVDPMTFLDMWVTDGGNNDAAYSNSEYDELINNAKSESDQKKRMEYMHKAEDILMEDMPIIPIYYYTNVVCIKDYVKGIHKSTLGMVYFDDAYLENKK